MNPVPASIKAPRFPQVNLVPPEIAIKRAKGRQRAGAIALLVVFVVALAGAGVYVNMLSVAVDEDLAASQQRNTELQTELARYSDVPRVRAALNNALDARAYAGATDMNYLEMTNRLLAALPEDAVLDVVSYNRVNLTNNPAQDTGPFGRADIGSVSISGWSTSPIPTADLADAFELVVGLERVRVNVPVRAVEEGVLESSGGGSDAVVYNFELTARLTVEALSGRFAPDDIPPPATTDPGDSADGDDGGEPDTDEGGV